MSVGVAAGAVTAVAGAYGAYKSSQAAKSGGGASGAAGGAPGAPGVNPSSLNFGAVNYRSSDIREAARVSTSSATSTNNTADNGASLTAPEHKETRAYLWIAAFGFLSLLIVLFRRRSK